MRLKLKLLPALIGLLIILQLVAPYQGWLALLVGLSVVWLISTLWAFSLSRNLKFKRTAVTSWAQVGDWLQETFLIENNGWAPALWIELDDHTNVPAYATRRVVAVNGRASRQWRVESLCQQRGEFTLGPLTLRTSDPFGIYTITQEYPDKSTLVVMPPIAALPTFEIAPNGRAGDGKQRAKAFEQTISTYSVRNYVPGDSLRSIHWRTTARRDELYMRLFDSTPAGDWWLFLDLEKNSHTGIGHDSTEEHAIILAASLADAGLKTGHAVGLATHGRDLTWLPPRVGDGQRWEILRALATATTGRHSLSQVFNRTRSALNQNTSLIVITASAETTWLESFLPLRQRLNALTVFALDPLTYGGADSLAPLTSVLTNFNLTHHLLAHDWLAAQQVLPKRTPTRQFGITNLYAPPRSL
jgi:uncharacterized protein (DUF58 family)